MKRDPIYGMMAEFDSAQALIDAARKTRTKPAIRRSTPTARSRSRVWLKKSDSITMKCLWSCSSAALSAA